MEEMRRGRLDDDGAQRANVTVILVVGVLASRVCRLAVAGAGLLVQVLDGIEAQAVNAVPQPHEGISTAPKLTVEDAQVRWGDPAFAVDRRVRACTPAPGAWTTLRGDRLKLGPVTP